VWFLFDFLGGLESIMIWFLVTLVLWDLYDPLSGIFRFQISNKKSTYFLSRIILDLIHLQSKFFPAKFFFCILEKRILAGKKFTLQRRLGDVHILRNAIFQLFKPPLPLVTKNRTNPYVLTMVRNKLLTPLLRALRNLWKSPYSN
jgi:hypothetical protein